MNREHVFKFGRIEFQDSYAVITCDEGVHIDLNEISEIEDIIHQTYQGHKFGLIAHRVNHYSVNPIAINKLFSNKYLIAGAIVGQTRITKENAELENKIVKEAPIKFFFDMDSAINWIKSIVE